MHHAIDVSRLFQALIFFPFFTLALYGFRVIFGGLPAVAASVRSPGIPRETMLLGAAAGFINGFLVVFAIWLIDSVKRGYLTLPGSRWLLWDIVWTCVMAGTLHGLSGGFAALEIGSRIDKGALGQISQCRAALRGVGIMSAVTTAVGALATAVLVAVTWGWHYWYDDLLICIGCGAVLGALSIPGGAVIGLMLVRPSERSTP